MIFAQPCCWSLDVDDAGKKFVEFQVCLQNASLFFWESSKNMCPNVFLPLSIHGDQLPLPVVPEICCRSLPFAMSGLSLVWDLGSRCFVPLDPWGGLFFQGLHIPSREMLNTYPTLWKRNISFGLKSDLLTNRICDGLVEGILYLKATCKFLPPTSWCDWQLQSKGTGLSFEVASGIILKASTRFDRFWLYFFVDQERLWYNNLKKNKTPLLAYKMGGIVGLLEFIGLFW